MRLTKGKTIYKLRSKELIHDVKRCMVKIDRRIYHLARLPAMAFFDSQMSDEIRNRPSRYSGKIPEFFGFDQKTQKLYIYPAAAKAYRMEIVATKEIAL